MSAPIPASSQNSHQSSLDGGLTALGGFFLQFVGTTRGVLSNFWVQEAADPTPDTAKITLFGVELGDTDAYSRSVSPNGQIKVRLVQFKFSLTPDLEQVMPGEMSRILDKMAKFAQERFSGQNIEVEFVMATNRPRSPEMEPLWQNRATTGYKDYFSTYPQLQKRLQKCQWEEVSAQQSDEHLKTWGREFGLTEEQITTGTLRIVSEFMPRVAEGRVLFTLSEIEKPFTGCHAPRRLNSQDTRNAINGSIEEFIEGLRVPILAALAGSDEDVTASETSLPSSREVRSEVFDRLSRAIGEHALVLLTGDGGNGKSTLLAFLLNVWAEAGFVNGTRLDQLNDNWITKTISGWRGDTRLDNEPSEAIVRLLGFSEKRPVLLLALDALDENQAAGTKQGEIRRLLNFFEREERRRPPRATLVVTCRRRADLNDFLGESANDLFASSEALNPGEEVHVGPFSANDLLHLLETRQGHAERLSDEVRHRLSDSLSFNAVETTSLGDSALSTTPLRLPISQGLLNSGKLNSGLTLNSSRNPRETLSPRSVSSLPLVKREILEALHHPVVWGCFCCALTDDTSQNAALDGEEKAVDQVCSALLKWFTDKCKRRCAVAVDPEEVREILLSVARQFGESGASYRRSQWRSAAQGCASSTAVPVNVLRQAISSGLIVGNLNADDDFQWQWRHPFWTRFLRAQALTQHPLTP